MKVAAIAMSASVAFFAAGCGSSGPTTLNQSQQASVGSAVGEAAVRCSLGSDPSSNTFMDPKITTDLNTVAGLYKQLGSHTKLGGGSTETLGQAVQKMVPQFSCAPTLAQILITATGGAPNAAANTARQQAQAEYQKCNTQLGGLITAESNLNSHLDVGMNFRDYTTAAGDVRAQYDLVPFHQLDVHCLDVGVHAENALKHFAKAAETWSNCFSDPNCSNDSIKPQLQDEWTKASDEITKTQSGMQALQNPGS
jgi:hypothetical protein